MILLGVDFFLPLLNFKTKDDMKNSRSHVCRPTSLCKQQLPKHKYFCSYIFVVMLLIDSIVYRLFQAS